jgi:hypothetical protein
VLITQGIKHTNASIKNNWQQKENESNNRCSQKEASALPPKNSTVLRGKRQLN